MITWKAVFARRRFLRMDLFSQFFEAVIAFMKRHLVPDRDPVFPVLIKKDNLLSDIVVSPINSVIFESEFELRIISV